MASGGKRKAERIKSSPRRDRRVVRSESVQPSRPHPEPALDEETKSVPAPASKQPSRQQLQMLWSVSVFGGAGLIGVLKYFSLLPEWVPRSIAVIVGCLLAVGLAIRSNGRWRLALLLSALLGLAGLLIPMDAIRAGCAVGAATSGACLGVLVTKPAPRYLIAAREVAMALAVALAGSLCALGFTTNLDHVRFGYVVLALSLGGSVAMVYRLGAGLHGLGSRGYLMVAGALALLTLALAYTAALRQWGSLEINNSVNDVHTFIKETFYATPNLIASFVGIPALAWGPFMRARRRQGWWVTAFGTAATAPMTMIAVNRSLPLLESLVSMTYSVVLGLLIGYLLVRVEQFLDTGATSKRARRAEEDQAHRPEPSRMSPLH